MMILTHDAFSHKATMPDDPLFYLRRLRDTPEILSDVNTGAVPDAEAGEMLRAFLVETGGIPGELVLAHLGYDDDSSDALAREEARLLGLLETACHPASLADPRREVHAGHVALRVRVAAHAAAAVRDRR